MSVGRKILLNVLNPHPSSLILHPILETNLQTYSETSVVVSCTEVKVEEVNWRVEVAKVLALNVNLQIVDAIVGVVNIKQLMVIFLLVLLLT